MIKEIEQLAAKQRRTDWIVGQHAIYAFYDRRLPAHVFDVSRLQRWLKKSGQEDARRLDMHISDLLGDRTCEDVSASYPDDIAFQKTRFPLAYRFEPGDDQDGVTMTVPHQAINLIAPEQVDWLVPGHMEEKITALIRSLPKSIRRYLVPAPDTARRAAEQIEFGDGPFLRTLANVLERLSGESIPADAFDLDRLPPHLVMKIRLVDDDGNTLAVDHSLDRLRKEFGSQAHGTAGQIDDAAWNRPATRDWDFGDVPAEVTVTRGGLRVPAYPAVVDQQDHVVVRLVDTPDRARQETRLGVRRLYYLAQRKPLHAHVAWLPRLPEIKLLSATLPGHRELDSHLALLIADRAFLGEDAVPRSEAGFRERLNDAAQRAALAVQDVTRLIHPLFESYQAARLSLEQLPESRWPAAAGDVRQQLASLVHQGFLVATPWSWLLHLPRFLRAATHRLDKLQHGGFARDQQAMEELATLARRLPATG